jgi:hypothetical protein
MWLDNDIPATTNHNTGTAGERGAAMSDYLTYNLTGDVLVDRAAWKAAGSPADHPYIVDCGQRPAGHAVSAPLAIEVSADQWATVQRISPILRAMSDANIRAGW